MTNKGKVLAAVIAVVVVLAGGVGLYLKGGDLMGKIFGSGNITRAELAKVVVAAITDPEGTMSTYDGTCFTDVPADSWYVDYVCYLADKDIMKGYPDGTFKPNQTINRADAATIFWLAYVYAIGGEGNIPQGVTDSQNLSPSPYTDVSKSAWYYEAVTGDAALGILDVKGWADDGKGSSGKKAKFYPATLLTKGRAQMWADKLSVVLGTNY